jgi:hypothetical protein
MVRESAIKQGHMSKNKIILGSVGVVAAIAIGAHFAAPSFFEGRFRTHLTSPNSGLGGTFANFELSLFGGTMSATNISLRNSEGVNFSADTLALENVNWLTLINANPFGDVLANQVTAENGLIEFGTRSIASPAISLGMLHITPGENGPTYRVESGEMTDLVIDAGPEHAVTADLVAFEDVDQEKLGKIAIQNLRYINPMGNEAVSMETMTADHCVRDLTKSLNIALPKTPLDNCGALSGTGVSISFDENKQITAAAFSVNQLRREGVESATLTEVEILRDDTISATVAEIDIKGIAQSLRRDAFDDDSRLSSREWQHLIDNLSIDHFSISGLLVEDDSGTGKLGTLAIDGLKDSALAKFQLAGIDIAVSDHEAKPNMKLGNFEISEISLTRIQRMFEALNVSASTDPEEHLEKMMTRTLGDLGALMSPLIYESVVLSDLSIAGDMAPDQRIEIGLERANASLGDPIALDGANMTFAKKARTAYEGLYVTISENSPIKPMIAGILGVEDFERISINGKGNITWDDTAGVFTHDIEDISIDDIGSISLSVSIANITRDVMTRILATRLSEMEKLQQIGLTEMGFGGARLEIKGEKLVKMFLRLLAQSKGQSPEELQMIGTMTLMQTQQNFAPFPKLAAGMGELATWLNNPQHLLIALAPNEPVPFGVIAAGGIQPNTAADLMGLTIRANDNVK